MPPRVFLTEKVLNLLIKKEPFTKDLSDRFAISSEPVIPSRFLGKKESSSFNMC